MPELVPGIYERLVTAQLSQALEAVDPRLVEREGFDPTDADEVLARRLWVHEPVAEARRSVRIAALRFGESRRGGGRR